MFPVFDIAIDKLRIQAAKKETALIAADLQSGSWHTGEQRQWFFIRQLAVSSPKNGLRLNASRHLQYETERAVHGASNDAKNANAVRFFSLADMLTFLVRDLAEGRTRSWYWEKWSHLFYLPKSEAITQLLWDNISEAAEIFRKLAARGELPQVWQQLSVQHAEILLARLASVQNVSLKALSPTLELRPERELEVDTVFGKKIANNLKDVFKHAEPIFSVWRKLLVSQSALDARFYFAAALTSVALAPQAMVQRPEKVIAAFYHCLNRSSSLISQNENNFSRGHSQDEPVNVLFSSTPQADSMKEQDVVEEQKDTIQIVQEQKKNSGKSRAENMRGDDSRPFSGNTVNENYADVGPSSTPVVKDEKVTSSTSVFTNTNSLSKDVKQNENFVDKFVDEEHSDYQFYTHFGGVFYLINAINHPESYANLRDEKEWKGMVSGWTLVHSLAQKLGADLDQNLLRFFADVAALPSVGELNNYQHPQLLKKLLPLFRQRYARTLHFDSSLLRIPARVSVSYSHVNVDYDMQAIRLPVRLSGLDVDPGWIPWLGRVVRLHFLDDIRLKGSENNE